MIPWDHAVSTNEPIRRLACPGQGIEPQGDQRGERGRIPTTSVHGEPMGVGNRMERPLDVVHRVCA